MTQETTSFLPREPDAELIEGGIRTTEVGQLREALRSAYHANHVLTHAINKVVSGQSTIERLRAWWIGPLKKEGGTK